ncbi:MAG: hypothetical protein FWJ65_12740, partial [Limnochordales bacterium]
RHDVVGDTHVCFILLDDIDCAVFRRRLPVQLAYARGTPHLLCIAFPASLPEKALPGRSLTTCIVTPREPL